MIIRNLKSINSASQAEGHEFEPRLPLLRKHSLIIKLLTDNRECFFFARNKLYT